MRGEISLFLLLGLTFVDCKRVPRQLFFNDAPSSDLCTTPDGVSGSCLNIKQCPPLLELLKKSKTIPGAADFLKRSLCRYDNSDPVVCCPQQSSRFPEDRPRNPTNTGIVADEFPQFPSPPYCGAKGNGEIRIVGGMLASLGDFPWITALGYRSSRNPTIQWLCGGALVTTRHVVTAAHCTRHPSLTLTKVRVGDLDLDESARDGANPVDVNVERAIAHPQYSPTKYTDDIAVVRLERDVPLSKNIQPICLPKLPELRQMDWTGKNLFIAGWGDTSFKGKASSFLQKAQVPVVTNEECRRAYNTKGADIISRQLCAGRGGKDACQGDSGGPLMAPYGPNSNNRSYYLVGVISYGYRCAEPGFPGVFSRTTSYLNWIAQNIN
ncbi:hypothetical protein O3M35_006466 [Rhynocoris fuscipes]|uniref:CLIP domain-containing serine protease n=1 Tax=Rhynocoris fuscipes TaxID=488301 RepID=A0AAW1DJF8_9HEMI